MAKKSKNSKNKKKNNNKSKGPKGQSQPRTLVLALAKPNSGSTKTMKNETSRSALRSVCALVDPFCDHAIGAKYPDQSSAKTLPYRMHYTVTIGTGPGGNAGWLFTPSWLFGAAEGVPTGTVMAYTTINNNNISGLFPNGFRIVSAGLRLRNLAAPLNASGYVSIRGYAAQLGVSLASVDAANYNSDFYQDIPLQSINLNGYTDVIFNRIDEIDSRQFNNPATMQATNTISSWISSGFGAVQIAIVGGPVNNPSCLSVEYVQHMELIFNDSDAMSVATTPPAKPNSQLTQVANYVSTQAGNVFHEIGKDVAKVTQFLARQAIVSFVQKQASSAGAEALLLM